MPQEDLNDVLLDHKTGNINIHGSKEVIVHPKSLVELIDQVQQLLVGLQLISVDVDALDVLGELYRAVDLHFLVGGRATRCHLLCLGSVEGCLELVVCQFVEDLEAILEGSY